MKNMIAAAALLAGAVVSFSPGTAEATTIQVMSGSGQRAFGIGFFGGTVGQTFTAVDSTLTSIGFQFEGLNPTFTGAPYLLSLFSSETLTGVPLVTRTFTLPTSINSRTPVFFDVDIGSTGVSVGQRYTAALTTSDTRNGIVLGPDINIFTGVPLSGDAYAGGRALFTQTVYPNCTNSPDSACDFNFRVTGVSAVSAVPEPASWVMMIGGFGVIGGAMRRRRRALAVFA
jgi:hypothetical protein